MPGKVKSRQIRSNRPPSICNPQSCFLLSAVSPYPRIGKMAFLPYPHNRKNRPADRLRSVGSLLLSLFHFLKCVTYLLLGHSKILQCFPHPAPAADLRQGIVSAQCRMLYFLQNPLRTIQSPQGFHLFPLLPSLYAFSPCFGLYIREPKLSHFCTIRRSQKCYNFYASPSSDLHSIFAIQL